MFKHEIVNAKPVSRCLVELENVLEVLKKMIQSNINYISQQGGTQEEVGEAGHVHLPETEKIEVAHGTDDCDSQASHRPT